MSEGTVEIAWMWKYPTVTVGTVCGKGLDRTLLYEKREEKKKKKVGVRILVPVVFIIIVM